MKEIKVYQGYIPSNEEWSNYACLGYAIMGAKKLGYSDRQVQQLVNAIYGEFDYKSVDEAKEIYVKANN